MNNARREHGVSIRSTEGRVIATIEDRDGCRTLVKTVHGSRHFLRRPPAIAFDADSIDQAEALGTVGIFVDDAETGRRYSSSMETFLRLAIDIDRGHGRQLALPLRFWDSPGPTGGAWMPETFEPAQTLLPFMEAA
jgi:hypothetical protein